MSFTVNIFAYLLVVSYFLAGPTSAYWRMSCMGVVGLGRIDPIVAPNQASPHMHTLKGSSGISPEATVDDLLNAPCTSCEISQDKSSYWSPQMFFYDSDADNFEPVDEVQGHLSYYKYVQAKTSDGKFKNPVALPNGMKMVSGNTFRRSSNISLPDTPPPWTNGDGTQERLQERAIGFNCLNYQKDPEPSLMRHFLPNKTFLESECPDGIRLEVLFPICWNGIDLTSSSDNFTSHMAYSDAGLNGGTCPPGYDTVVNQLFFETIYPTQNFIGRNGFYAFANADTTGYGYHGDAFIAWDEGVQENATELCGNQETSLDTSGVPSDCPIFNIQSMQQQAACKLPSLGGGPGNVNLKSNLDIAQDGPMALAKLPGNNPILPSGATPSAIPLASQSLAIPSPPVRSLPIASPSVISSTLEASPTSSPITAGTSSTSLSIAPAPSSTSLSIAPAPSPTSPTPSNVQVVTTSIQGANGAWTPLVEVITYVTTTIYDDGSIYRRSSPRETASGTEKKGHLGRHRRRHGGF